MSTSTSAPACSLRSSRRSLLVRINEEWHKPALQIFALIVIGHWAEHLVQAFQIYVLDRPVPESRGILGQFYPWLVKSEALHYGYALVMLCGLWFTRKGFVGRSYKWWMISFGIQFWHHIEHALLQGQALFGANLFDRPVPVSIVQLWVPRVELHLFYNTAVFIPMAIGMYYHVFPPKGEEAHAGCGCAWKPKSERKKGA